MLKNYLKIALRNLQKQKGFAFINIFGLAVGIACCVLIMLFVKSELSYDRFHAKADHLYRAFVDEQYEGQRFFNTVTPIPLGPTLEATFPEVEASVRVDAYADLVRRGATQFTERIHMVDSTFFEVFDFPLLRGDPASALDPPNRVVLTEDIAQKYFGGEDPMGQALSMRVGDDVQEFTVAGVAAEPPEHSSIQFDLLISYAHVTDRYSEQARSSWYNVYGETYVLLRGSAEAEALEAKLSSMVRQVLGSDYEEGTYAVGLQPITDIHLNPNFPAGIEPTSDPAYAYILSAIALLVLLIACINFVTLSLGRSTDRAKEVGIRKTVGAHRGQLVGQFWGETLLLAALALTLGLVLAGALLPLFGDLAGRSLSLSFNPALLVFLGGVLLVVGLIAGSYPALVLSAFEPAEVLKGKLQLKGDKSLFRRGLVVVQFALAIFLIASTLVMVRQMSYLQTKNLGFDKEQVVTLPTTGSFGEGFRAYELLRQELAGEPGIAGVAAASFSPGADGWAEFGYNDENDQYREFNANFVSYDFIETMGIEMRAGRSFSRAYASDTSRGIVVNEALVREYGWENPIGQHLPGPFDDHEVIGVAHDFHYASLHTPIEPLVLAANPDLVTSGASNVMFPSSPQPEIAVRIEEENVPATMGRIEAVWERVAPEQPFSFTFLDAAVDSQYRQEERLSSIVGIGAALSIFIACLGLFGLAALTAARRTKEIGVRKVSGASVPQIVALLSKDFLRLVGIAFVVAAPVAYFAMSRWLEDFAYRTEISWWIFLMAGLAALLIALLTVSYQTVKAALADPVESLRYE